MNSDKEKPESTAEHEAYGMIHRHAPFSHHRFQIAQTQAISQVLSDAQ